MIPAKPLRLKKKPAKPKSKLDKTDYESLGERIFQIRRHDEKKTGKRKTRRKEPEVEPQIVPLTTEDGHAILAEIKATNGQGDKYTPYEQAPEFDPDAGALGLDSARSALELAAGQTIKQTQLSDRMYDDEDVDIKTRLTKRQIVALEIAEMEAKLHNTPMLLEFCEGLKRKNISLGGESRREAVQMTQGQNALTMSVDAKNRTTG